MKHLTVEEMIGFVSFHSLDEETRALAARVNSHILRCDACRERVAAYQNVYDELEELGQRENDRLLRAALPGPEKAGGGAEAEPEM